MEAAVAQLNKRYIQQIAALHEPALLQKNPFLLERPRPTDYCLVAYIARSSCTTKLLSHHAPLAQPDEAPVQEASGVKVIFCLHLEGG
jgi:hypothetical protein